MDNDLRAQSNFGIVGIGQETVEKLLLLFLWAGVQPTLDPYAETFL